MSGSWGQRVFVQPASGLVMVHTGVWKSDVDPKAAAELSLLWDSVLRSAGGYPQ